MLKKIFRSSYENVMDEKGRVQHQTVNEIKAVEVPSIEERWGIIGDMSRRGYHQVIVVHDIQASFILSTLQRGARLTDIVLREVEKPEVNQGEERGQKPAKSLLSRFLGIGENSIEMKESQARIHAEKIDLHNEYLAQQAGISEWIEQVNRESGSLIRFYEEIGNHYVDIVKVEYKGTVFTLESNGFFSYEPNADSAQMMESLLVSECLRYFT